MARELLSIRGVGRVTVVDFVEPQLEAEAVVHEAGERLYALHDQGLKDLVLNFADVRFVSSTLLGKLIGLYRRIHPAGGHVVLCGLTPYLRAIFETSRLDRLMPIHEDEEQAVAALEQTLSAS